MRFHALVAILAVLAMLGPVAVSGQSVKWVRQFGTEGFDLVRGVAVDDSGLFVVGAASDALPGQEYQGGPRDAYLRKYNFGGHERWTHQFGTPGVDVGTGIDVAGDGSIVIVGFTTGELPGQTHAGSFDAFVRKYDFKGNVMWTHQFGTALIDFGAEVDVDTDGSIYVAGASLGELPGQTSAGLFDIFVRKYTADGVEVWTRQFGSAGDDLIGFLSGGVAVEEGKLYVAGFVGDALPGQSFGGAPFDAFVRRYTSDGDEVWTRQFGGVGFQDIHGIGVLRGDVYVAGSTQSALPGQTYAGGAFDAFIRKYDDIGNELWTHQVGTDGFDHFNQISVGETGIYVVGFTDGVFPNQVSAGGLDLFVQKYDADGSLVWARQFGTSGFDQGADIAVHDDAGLIIAGFTEGDLRGENAGIVDAFVLKLLPLEK